MELRCWWILLDHWFCTAWRLLLADDRRFYVLGLLVCDVSAALPYLQVNDLRPNWSRVCRKVLPGAINHFVAPHCCPQSAQWSYPLCFCFRSYSLQQVYQGWWAGPSMFFKQVWC